MAIEITGMRGVEETREGLPDDALSVSEAAPGKLPVHELLAPAWRHRLRLAKATLAGLVLGAAASMLVPKRYESTAQLMPPDPQAISGAAMLGLMAGGGSGSTMGLANSILSGKTPSSQFIGILESRTVRDSLIDRFDLRRVYGKKYYVDARRRLAKRTEFSEDKKTGIITITVTDHDAIRARDLAEAYIEELNQAVTRVSTSSARRERIFLEERLQIVEKELAEDSRQLSQFSSRNITLDPQAQGRATLEGAARLQGELIAAESELSGLEAIYSDSNTRVQSLRARIAEMKTQMRKLAGTREQGEKGAEEREDGGMYPSMRRLPLLGMTFVDLSRRVKVQEAVYEALVKQYELAKVQEAKEIPTISVLDAPLVPEKKCFPPRSTFTLLSGCLAFLFALGWTAAERRLQSRGVHQVRLLLKPEGWRKLAPKLGVELGLPAGDCV
jgi:uncharacterized protein involved in exopolysaccharide biosynthesis